MRIPLLISLLLFPPACSGQAPAAPRGVIFLDICSARADHFGAYGYKRPTTPSIDALAGRVIRDKRWKLHWYLYKDGYELYDLEKDPLETEDLSSKEPQVLRRLSLELLKQVERVRPHSPGLPAEIKIPDGGLPSAEKRGRF